MQSRYIPFSQQRYCCVPACLQIVMYHKGLPLVSQDELGYALGLTVPKEEAKNYSRVRTGDKPSSGWGTQIQNPLYEINGALAGINVPLRVDVDTDIRSTEDLQLKLQTIQDDDGDAFVCFDYGKLWDLDVIAGHVSVFDRLDDDTVWLVESQPNEPKFRQTSLSELLVAMESHGARNSAGIWTISNA